MVIVIESLCWICTENSTTKTPLSNQSKTICPLVPGNIRLVRVHYLIPDSCQHCSNGHEGMSQLLALFDFEQSECHLLVVSWGITGICIRIGIHQHDVHVYLHHWVHSETLRSLSKGNTATSDNSCFPVHLKLSLLSSQYYFREIWNVFDFIVVLGSLLDVALQYSLVCQALFFVKLKWYWDYL